ncbi:unnamed protein product [Phaeothamnion confervicola]
MDWKEKGLQQCGSYIEGLTADPWHDTEAYSWALGLEENWKTIAIELSNAMKKKNLAQRGNNVWAAAAREEAMAYGPDWRTLVLQDRTWDAANSAIFKKTTKIIKDLGVPSCEVFFARQEPRTGIKPHTDNCNFILTAHLGLDVPEGECWIRVGNERRDWRNGRTMVFDTSFEHETDNATDLPRTVLLIRFWHPEVTAVERDALSFIFAALEDPEVLTPALTPQPFVPDWMAVDAPAGPQPADSRAERRRAERERRKQEERD